jgi:hypothetical protein
MVIDEWTYAHRVFAHVVFEMVFDLFTFGL